MEYEGNFYEGQYLCVQNIIHIKIILQFCGIIITVNFFSVLPHFLTVRFLYNLGYTGNQLKYVLVKIYADLGVSINIYTDNH